MKNRKSMTREERKTKLHTFLSIGGSFLFEGDETETDGI